MIEGKKMKRNFIILELGWEYNDQNYYLPECGGGTPIKSYSDFFEAKKACNEMNIKWKEENKDDMFNYIEEWKGVSSILSEEGADFLLKELAKEWKKEEENLDIDDIVPWKIPRNIWEKLAPYITVENFEVVEVEHQD